jgi:hypothetical protein
MVSDIDTLSLQNKNYLRGFTMEIEIWAIWSSNRIASAIMGLTGMISIWIAARFASVMMEKGANLLGKITVTVFGICVLLMNGVFMLMAQTNWNNTAKTFAAMRDSGTEISPIAAEFVAKYGANDPSLTNTPIFLVLLISVLVLLIGTVWFQPEK